MSNGEAIEAYQKAHNLSDNNLAVFWGVSPRMVAFIKKGERIPGNKTLRGARKNTPELYPVLLKISMEANGND